MELRFRRSGGIPVGFLTHRRIARANRARDAGDWAAARAGYARALAGDAGLFHVWLQLGHAEKELGHLAEADAAYVQASRLRPDDAEPPLHRGHVAKLGGHDRAFDLYLAALDRRRDAETLGELHRLLMQAPRPEREERAARLRRTMGLPARRQPAGQMPGLLLDLSDLIAFFSHSRLPTGIQRVQIEVASALLGKADGSCAACAFVGGMDGWAMLPHDVAGQIIALAVADGGREDPAWIDALGELYSAVAEAPPLAFPAGARLVNLGTSWALPNYFLHLRAAKARAPLAYVPLVYDLIPLVRPDWFPADLVRHFAGWADEVFAHADLFLAGSAATRLDLIDAAAARGVALAAQDVVAVPLDGDFRKAAPAPEGELRRWGLSPGGFVLFVATLEPRKGHADAFAAWSALLARLGPARVPRLVCVGGRGWLNDDLHRMLAEDARLAAHVLRLTGLSDAELALLYRSCRFTLYPSLYEGWGLPVSEALSWGKVPLTTDVASLPEAGGPFAVYVPAGDAGALAAAAERLILDDGWLAEREAAIVRGYRARTWAAIAGSIADTAGRATGMPVPTPEIAAETSYRFGHAAEEEPAALPGERLRSGLGWAAPDAGECRVLAGGGELRFRSPPGILSLELVGLPDRPSRYAVGSLTGRMDAGERRQVTMLVEDGETRLTLTGDPVARVARREGLPDPAVSVGLARLGLRPLETR